MNKAVLSIRSHRRSAGFLAVCLVALLTACEPQPESVVAAGVPCEAGNFIIEDRFDGARRGSCEVFEDGRVRVTIVPEDEGRINNSPWYAFRVVPKQAGTARLELRYEGGDHRYWPKWSKDGHTWQALPAERLETTEDGIRIHLELAEQPQLIAAQELILPSDMSDWTTSIAEHAKVTRSTLGHSVGGEIIDRLDINSNARDVIFLAGRQHPPEVTGAVAFTEFVETLLADTELGNAFRQRFHIVAIPMLNPDGVIAGHWRHNLNGVDLNRDWGPFEQPETRLVLELLDALDAAGKRVRASVDFHSTKRNLMYTQASVDLTEPPDFSRNWIIAAKARLPGVAFDDEPRPLSERATSRNYMHKRYGIPAVTYEVGDHEDRDIVRQTAAVFAEEFMRLFLETEDTDRSSAISVGH